MLSALILEYESFVKKRRAELLFALICYYRMPKFRVRVLTRWLTSSRSDFWKERIANKLLIKYGMDIAKNACIGYNISFEHYNGIVIGKDSRIGDNCKIYQQVTIGQKNNEYPQIGNNVTIYPGAKIIGGIKVGDNVVVGANSVVLHDVAAGSVVAGVPAIVIKSGKSEND